MNKIKIPHILTLILLGLLKLPYANASTVVIDFNNAPLGSFLDTVYFEDGFKMKVISGHYDIVNEPFSLNGTNFLGLDEWVKPSVVKFTHSQSLPFDFLSFEDINLYSLVIESSAGGKLAQGSTGFHSIQGNMWRDITWLSFTSTDGIGGIGVDSITLKTVPLPTALLLFASGLAGFMTFIRSNNHKRQII